MKIRKKGFISVEYVIVAGIVLLAFMFFGGTFLLDETSKYDTIMNQIDDDKIIIENPGALPNYTKSTCFVVGVNSTITNYDATCGQNVVIPKTINDEPILHIANSAFQGKTLLSVTFPDGLLTIGENAFRDNNLSNVVLPNTLVSIGNEAFMNNRIETLYIPNTLSTMGLRVFNSNRLDESNAFIYEYTTSGINRTKIMSYGGFDKTVTVPYYVVTIADGAFSNNGLESVRLLELVNNIETAAFASNNLTSVIFECELPEFLGYDIFTGNVSLASNTISVPESQLSLYKAKAWSNFYVPEAAFY